MSRTVFGTLNYFGGPLETSPKLCNQLLHLEQADDSAMMVFVSDLWLDKPQVVQKFNQVLFYFWILMQLQAILSRDGFKLTDFRVTQLLL